MPPVAADPVAPIRRKLFYKINEVSKITGLKPYILRYWETEFPQIRPEKDENDQRRYRQQDIDVILKIKHLLYERKYTIAGAKQQIAAESAGGGEAERDAPAEGVANGEPGWSAVAARALKQLGAIRAELEDLLAWLS